MIKNPWYYLCQWDILIQRVVYFPFQKSLRVSVNLPLRCNYGIENKGIIVQSSAPITVMGNNQGGGSTQDVFLVNALRDISIQYLVVSPEPRRNNGIFTVICAYNGTSVAIWKPSPSGYVHWKTVELNRLDTFTFMEKTDPSGYKVISNRPVSVQSGSEKERISARMTYIDHMCVSLAPTLYNGGADYYIIPITIRNNPGAYHVKMVAVYNLTVVSDLKNSGNHIATLGAGQHLENGPVISGTPVTVLRCSKPCTVMQFNMGSSYDGTANIDGFQMWIPLYIIILSTSISSHRTTKRTLQCIIHSWYWHGLLWRPRSLLMVHLWIIGSNSGWDLIYRMCQSVWMMVNMI